MTVRTTIAKVFQQEDINFLLTNRIPRRLLTQFMGWFSRIEQPLVRDASIALWRFFSDLDLSDAKKRNSRSLHDCFTRELKEGARPIDPDPACYGQPLRRHRRRLRADRGPSSSRSRAFLHARICWATPALVERHRDGRYVTLRLTSSMYHRFHAPHDCRVEERHLHLRRHLERQSDRAAAHREAVLQERAGGDQTRLAETGDMLTLVPVAAILVASIRLHFLKAPLDSPSRPQRHAAPHYRKGEEWAGSSTARPSSCWHRQLIFSFLSNDVHAGTPHSARATARARCLVAARFEVPAPLAANSIRNFKSKKRRSKS